MTNTFGFLRQALLLIASIFIAACHSSHDQPKPPHPSTYTISGKVADASSGVTVTIQGPESRSTVTDSTGTFTVAGLPPGHYAISPSQAGFVFEPVFIQVDLVDQNISVPAFARKMPTEGLSVEELARIDAVPEFQTPANQIILPNGKNLEEYLRSRNLPLPALAAGQTSQQVLPATSPTGPQQRKNDIIATMMSTAQDFSCARRQDLPCTKWNYTAEPSDPVNQPAQSGLSYVYGGRTPAVRTLPLDGCTQKTHGTDCSGLVSLASAAAGLNAPATSAAQSNPDNWSFPADWQLKMKLVTDGSIQTGDLVWWSGHIGLAVGSDKFVSSTGTPGQCIPNIKPPRGPRELSYANFGRGQPTKVLRLTTTLSGTWDMSIRCAGQATDAAIIRFTINNEGGGAFTANGSGTDYNGTPLSFILGGTYNQDTNTVDATLALTDGTRSDHFTQTLFEDDTGYFALTKVIDNRGCIAEARLVRVPAGSPLRSPVPPAAGSAANGYLVPAENRR